MVMVKSTFIGEIQKKRMSTCSKKWVVSQVSDHLILNLNTLGEMGHIYYGYSSNMEMGVILEPSYIYIYEPPSKSIVYAWYKNISYRSLGGALSFSSVLFKST